MAELESLLPRRLAGDYEALALLHEGPGRQSLLLRDLRSGEKLVLKRSLDGLDRPEAEYALLRELAGEGIPEALCCFQEDGAAYLLRRYVPGESLLDYLQRRGALPAEECIALGLALCRVVRRLHEHNPPVIHRDIKVENLIRTPAGELVLIDFGIAHHYEREARTDTRFLGTPGSAAPEQFGYRQTDQRTDLYAVGCLLHVLSTGEEELDRGVEPAVLRPVIRRCVRFDPAERYPSAAALERALRRVSARGRRRWRAIVWTAAVLTVLLGALLLPSLARPAACSFADPVLEAEVCRQLGKAPGTVTTADLGQIRSLLLVGDQPVSDWDCLMASGSVLLVEGLEMPDGGWQGKVESLADLAMLPNLRELALYYENLDDLSGLAGLALERLALHGNRIGDLGPLADSETLQELFIGDNPLSDLSPLTCCPSLWYLNAGGTGIQSLECLRGHPALSVLQVGECGTLTELGALESLPRLNNLALGRLDRAQLEILPRLTALEYLSLWGWDELEDVTLLTPLTRLRWLYLDMWRLSALTGLEELRALEDLSLHSERPLDLRPLAALERLRSLDVSRVETEDWSPLLALPALERLTCTAEQEADLRALLGDRPLNWNII